MLFSRLFCVAASRLNSPRFQLCLYALSNLTVKQACYHNAENWPAFARAQLSDRLRQRGGSTRYRACVKTLFPQRQRREM